ncbi:MAG: glycosyltransferase family 39 protein [Bacteroidales bacterium]|jgi:hypothetical protein|nr:glycosyltransferase family 39 protein [Bacteroidales bacterium]
MNKPGYKRAVIFLILISTIIRSLLALSLELGPEEAYYWTFALYPELSNFDQPPMIGWFVQLFTNNLIFGSEFFVRLASIVSGSASIWIVFIIGRRIKGDSAGFYSALLYCISFYLSIISGMLLLPEAPQTLFYLLALYFIIEGVIPKKRNCSESRILCTMALIIAGIFIGLATLSKFSSVFLWFGIFVYAVSFDRSLFKRAEFYAAFIISLIFLIPVYIWNIKNSYVGFEHLSGLVHISKGINFKTLLAGFFIPILINNPLNIVIITRALQFYKHHRNLTFGYIHLLLSLSIPVIVISITMSAFSESFIYAVSLGISPLIFIGGSYLSDMSVTQNRLITQGILKWSITLFVATIIFTVVHLYSGIFNFQNIAYHKNISQEKRDITLSRYGWRELSEEFGKIRDRDIYEGRVSRHSYIIDFNYKRAAQIDFYLARPNNTIVKTFGKRDKTRKYEWITQKLGGLKLGESMYYIESSLDKESAVSFGENFFERRELASTVYIMRAKKPVLRYRIYRFINLIEYPVTY